MTYDDAIKQLQAQIAAKGKFSVSNVPDYMLGLAAVNKDQLQTLLDQFLTKHGVLTGDDQKAMQDLLDKQKQNRQEKTKIILRDAVVGLLTLSGIVGVYFLVRHKKIKR